MLLQMAKPSPVPPLSRESLASTWWNRWKMSFARSGGTPRPWSITRTVTDAAARARCGTKVIYQAVRSNQLKTVRIGGRRDIRTKDEWIDNWLEAS